MTGHQAGNYTDLVVVIFSGVFYNSTSGWLLFRGFEWITMI